MLASEVKKESLVLLFLSHPRSSKFSETWMQDQFSLLSRKCIDDNKIYSILQKGISSIPGQYLKISSEENNTN